MEDSSESKSVEPAAAAAAVETNPADKLRSQEGRAEDEEVAAKSEQVKPEAAITSKSKRLAVRPTSLFSSTTAAFAKQELEQHMNRGKKMTNDQFSTQSMEESSDAINNTINNSRRQNVQIKQQQSSGSATNSAQTVISVSTNAESSGSATNNQQQQHNLGLNQAARTGAGSAGDLSQQTDPQNPYPLYAPITFFYLNQTARPRSWCLAIVSNKYPSPFNNNKATILIEGASLTLFRFERGL